MEASTWANKVVGIFTNFNPLLVKLEIKADKSPITPPPNAITQSDLLKLFFKSFSIILFATLILLVFSFERSLNIFTSYFFNDIINFFNNFFGNLLSLIMHILFTLGRFFFISMPVFFKILFPK